MGERDAHAGDRAVAGEVNAAAAEEPRTGDRKPPSENHISADLAVRVIVLPAMEPLALLLMPTPVIETGLLLLARAPSIVTRPVSFKVMPAAVIVPVFVKAVPLLVKVLVVVAFALTVTFPEDATRAMLPAPEAKACETVRLPLLSVRLINPPLVVIPEVAPTVPTMRAVLFTKVSGPVMFAASVPTVLLSARAKVPVPTSPSLPALMIPEDCVTPAPVMLTVPLPVAVMLPLRVTRPV